MKYNLSKPCPECSQTNEAYNQFCPGCEEKAIVCPFCGEKQMIDSHCHSCDKTYTIKDVLSIGSEYVEADVIVFLFHNGIISVTTFKKETITFHISKKITKREIEYAITVPRDFFQFENLHIFLEKLELI